MRGGRVPGSGRRAFDESPRAPWGLPSRWMRAALAVLLVAAGAGAAQAGACPSPRLKIVSERAPVPTNAQLRVVFDDDRSAEVLELVDGTSSIVASGVVDAADFEVLVREDAGGAVVPTLLRRSATIEHPSFIVQPTQALAPNTRYALVVHTKIRDFVVSRFTTTDGPDTTPPTLGDVARARFFRWKESKQPHWKDLFGSFAEITLGERGGALGYEIHELAPGEQPSDATLRTVITDQPGTTLRFGVTYSCNGSDFAFPPVPKHARSQLLHLWIRAFDAAGNVSPLREVVLDLAKQRAK